MGNSKSKACAPKLDNAKKTGVLNISNAQLSNKSSLWESESFLSLATKLKVLDITANELVAVPNQVSSFTGLKTLNIASCQISSGPDMTSLTSLGSLDLAHNRLESGSLFPFPISVKKLKLQHNLFSEFPVSILNLVNLAELNLSSNKLPTIDGIGALIGLVELILDDNFILIVPSEIGNLRKLRVISLERNRLLGYQSQASGLQSLPRELFESTVVISINLKGNLELTKKDLARFEGVDTFMARRKDSKDRNLSGGAMDNFEVFGVE
jgi:Leucine-rich repeat (LRR) protein